MTEIYVVKAEADGMGRFTTEYVGTNVAKAVDRREGTIEQLEEHPQDLKVFIDIWESGNYQRRVNGDPRLSE